MCVTVYCIIRNFILRRKLTDHGHGEGRVDFTVIISWGGGGGGGGSWVSLGGEVELFGGKFPLRPPP